VGHIRAGDQAPRRDRHLELGALDGEFTFLLVPEHRQVHVGLLGTPDPLADLFEFLPLYALAVHRNQDVPRLDPRFLGG
jgi:hypothetical protein